MTQDDDLQSRGFLAAFDDEGVLQPVHEVRDDSERYALPENWREQLIALERDEYAAAVGIGSCPTLDQRFAFESGLRAAAEWFNRHLPVQPSSSKVAACCDRCGAPLGYSLCGPCNEAVDTEATELGDLP